MSKMKEQEATAKREREENEARRVTLQNGDVRVAFVPASGGCMTELTDLRAGRQLLRRPQEVPSDRRSASYGDDFAAGDPSGFDECFPTVAPSTYRFDGRSGEGVALPDHGELWARPWTWSKTGQGLRLSIDGVRLDYRFEKEVWLEGRRVHLRYRLQSREACAFPYIWSAHPLLKVEPGMRIALPPEVERVRIESTTTLALGAPSTYRSWPHLAGSDGPDYARVQPRSMGQAIKCFTPALKEKGAALHGPGDAGEILRLRFGGDRPLHLGLWLCYGGWPPGDEKEWHHTIALEPATAPYDALDEAAAQGACPVLQPGGRHEWKLELEVDR